MSFDNIIAAGAKHLVARGLQQYIDQMPDVPTPQIVNALFAARTRISNTTPYTSPFGTVGMSESTLAASIAKLVFVMAIPRLAQLANVSLDKLMLPLSINEWQAHVKEIVKLREGSPFRYVSASLRRRASFDEIAYALLNRSSERLLPMLRGSLSWDEPVRPNSIKDLMLRARLISDGQPNWMEAFLKFVREEMGIQGWTPTMAGVFVQPNPNLIENIPEFFMSVTRYLDSLVADLDNVWSATIVKYLVGYTAEGGAKVRDVGFMNSDFLQKLAKQLEPFIAGGIDYILVKTGDVYNRYVMNQILLGDIPPHYTIAVLIYVVPKDKRQKPTSLWANLNAAMPMYRDGNQETPEEASWVNGYLADVFGAFRRTLLLELNILYTKDG